MSDQKPLLKARNRKHLSNTDYEVAWEAFKTSRRTVQHLAVLLGISWQTARRLVEDGYPKRGLPSLQERAKLWDAQQAQRDREEVIEQVREQRDEAYKFRKDVLKIVHAGKATIANLVLKMHQAAQTATFVEYDKDGKPKPIAAQKLVDALARGAGIVKDFATVGSLMHGDPTERTLHQFGNNHPLAKLTDEQLEHIAETGRLPDGVDEAEILNFYDEKKTDTPTGTE